jgi:hypothetical protein
MMSEHLSQNQLTGYREHTLESHELLRVDRHLASCDVCHERLTQILPGKVAGEPLVDEPFHLDYEQHLEPYVDGKADKIDREIVESHVAECSQCADELRDLLAFKEQPVGVTSFRRKQWLPRWSWLPRPALAVAAVLAMFVVAIGVLWWTRYQAPQPRERVQTGSPSPAQPSPTEHIAQQTPSPAPREEPLIALNDAGGQVTVNQQGRLEGLQELPPDLRDSVERTLATRRLHASPALTGWLTGAGDLRSGSDMQSTFAPLEPTDVVIETDRPTFRWRALEDARDYVVTIFDAMLRKVASSGPVSVTEWTIPNPLARGVTYSWQISAVKDGQTVVTPKPPLPEARFRILDQPAFAALAKLKKSVGSSHLALGVFYWKHGLLAESEREFQALAKANPNSPAATELLASIRSLRHGR